MADTGKPDDGPSLEMPSFSLRRRKARRSASAQGSPAPLRPESPGDSPAPEPLEVESPGDSTSREAGSTRRSLARPGLPAAALTGVVVGLLAVLLAWLAGAGCDAVRGTSSCGGALGLPLLLVGLLLLAWAGATMLRLLGVAGPGSTSALAVGVLAVLVMLFLLDVLDEWWSAVLVPALSALAYALSWRVTASAAAEEAPAAETHDVR